MPPWPRFKSNPFLLVSRRLDAMSLECHAKPLANCAEDRSQIVHARIALLRKHAVQALAWAIGFVGQILEPDRGIDQVTKDQARNVRFAVEEKRPTSHMEDY